MPELLLVVVDDEPTVRSYVAGVLQRDGYRTLEAENGVEGLALIRGLGTIISLVVSDLQMPRLNGYQLSSAVRAEFPTIPILLMSGHAEEPPDGFPFIAKPFTTAKFRNAIQTVLAQGSRTSPAE